MSGLLKFACNIGIHNYKVIHKTDYDNIGIPDGNYGSLRQCSRCFNLQEEDVHCLGLNPPDYVHSWYDKKGKPVLDGHGKFKYIYR